MRGELGDTYVEHLRTQYAERVPGGADLVTYWFERARALIAQGTTKRAGLLATQGIRGIANRRVLEQIKCTGNIFMAWSDRPWILGGAAVRVALVGFDDGSETERFLNGVAVEAINTNLTSSIATTQAVALPENKGLNFLGMMKAGPFELDGVTARRMLAAPLNPNRRPNADVVKRRLGGQDVVGRWRDGWIVDFGVDMTEQEAALYEEPFEHVRKNVKPLRDKNRRDSMRTRWWIHGEPRRGLRASIAAHALQRVIVTPEVAKHRLFIWMDTSVVPDHKLHVFVRDDDYFFGVLHSRVHEVWTLATCSWLGVGNDPSYSSTRTFETFPFPWPPGQEPQSDPLVLAIAAAAQRLVELRDNWLNPPRADAEQLKLRTLTKLYNERPAWLTNAHRELDAAVLAAYSWPSDLSDEELLARLLALNLDRHGAAQHSGVALT